MAGTICRKRLQVWLKDPRLPHVCSKKRPTVVKNEQIAVVEQWKARERWQMLLTTRAMLVNSLSMCGTIGICIKVTNPWRAKSFFSHTRSPNRIQTKTYNRAVFSTKTYFSLIEFIGPIEF